MSKRSTRGARPARAFKPIGGFLSDPPPAVVARDRERRRGRRRRLEAKRARG